MAIATLVSGEIMGNGRTIMLYWHMDQPSTFGVPDWYGPKVSGGTCYLNNNAPISFRSCYIHSNVPAQSGYGGINQFYNTGTRILSLTGAFVNYRPWISGDRLNILSRDNDGNTFAVPILDRFDDHSILLGTGLGGISGFIFAEMNANQGTKLVWRSEYVIVNSGDTIPVAISGIVFSSSTGILSDGFGNITDGINNFPLANNSLVDRDGFTTVSGFSRGPSGVIVYVAPGFGSDSNTFTQAQNTTTPYATFLAAVNAMRTNAKHKTGSVIRILEGTICTGSAQIRAGGYSRLQPLLIESYWDNTAGVGTSGIRPVISGAVSISDSFDVSNIVVRGLEFAGAHTAADAMFQVFTSYNGVTFDDCVFRDGRLGVNVQTVWSKIAPDIWQNNVFINRCIFYNHYGSGIGHTQGIYSYGVTNLLVSQCTFDFCGRIGNEGFGSNIFSRSMYHDSESGPTSIWGCYISRSDGIQLRAGGSITDTVLSQSAIAGFVGAGGRIARTYTEYGANFGDSPFISGTYIDSTKRLIATGIGVGMLSGYTVYIGSGITGNNSGVYKIDVVDNNHSVKLGRSGLLSVFDGFSGIYGATQTLPRGIGFQLSAGNEFRPNFGAILELNVSNRLSQFCRYNMAYTISNGASSYYPAELLKVIVRNNTAFMSGPLQLDISSSGFLPNHIDKYQNLIDNIDSNSACEEHSTNAAATNYGFLSSDNNYYVTNTSDPFSMGGIYENLAEYQSHTQQDNHSISTTGIIIYNNANAVIGNLAQLYELGSTSEDFSEAMKNRPKRSWSTKYDAASMIDYLLYQYCPINIGVTGTSPLNFYGAGSLDPTIYYGPSGGRIYPRFLRIYRRSV